MDSQKSHIWNGKILINETFAENQLQSNKNNVLLAGGYINSKAENTILAFHNDGSLIQYKMDHRFISDKVSFPASKAVVKKEGSSLSIELYKWKYPNFTTQEELITTIKLQAESIEKDLLLEFEKKKHILHVGDYVKSGSSSTYMAYHADGSFNKYKLIKIINAAEPGILASRAVLKENGLNLYKWENEKKREEILFKTIFERTTKVPNTLKFSYDEKTKNTIVVLEPFFTKQTYASTLR